jgi:hypothetical protein
MTFLIAAILCLFLIFLYGLFVAHFYHSLHDPSASAPLYDGPVILDARQKPLPSRFNHATTAAEVVEGLDLRGKIIVITGGENNRCFLMKHVFILRFWFNYSTSGQYSLSERG